jgi:para-aminobenzoate synthetase / 4-amino-4-deoxychorismate lyase
LVAWHPDQVMGVLDEVAGWTSVRDAYTSRLASHPEADDVVVVNEQRELVGSCRANLAVCRDGTWWTPPAGSGCLPGVERARLLREGRMQERRLHLTDLVEAQGIALISSARGWRPASLTSPPLGTTEHAHLGGSRDRA